MTSTAANNQGGIVKNVPSHQSRDAILEESLEVLQLAESKLGLQHFSNDVLVLIDLAVGEIVSLFANSFGIVDHSGVFWGGSVG